MLLPPDRAVEFLGGFVEFQVAICRDEGAAVAERLHLSLRPRLESARDREVLMQHGERTLRDSS